jgi:hypothetical protein
MRGIARCPVNVPRSTLHVQGQWGNTFLSQNLLSPDGEHNCAKWQSKVRWGNRQNKITVEVAVERTSCSPCTCVPPSPEETE